MSSPYRYEHSNALTVIRRLLGVTLRYDRHTGHYDNFWDLTTSRKLTIGCLSIEWRIRERGWRRKMAAAVAEPGPEAE